MSSVLLISGLILLATPLYGPKAQNNTLGDHPYIRKPVLETEHFTFNLEAIRLPVSIFELEEQAEIIYNYVSTRFGVSIDRKITVFFEPPRNKPCDSRAIAIVGEDSDSAIVFHVPEDMSSAYLFGILAHEVGHVINWAIEPTLRARGMTEGIASWAAGEYWLALFGHSSLDEAVRSYLAVSQYIPLQELDTYMIVPEFEEHYLEDCIQRRDILYTEWASFIAYLISIEGLEKLFAYLKGRSLESVYLRSLADLETAWLSALDAATQPE